MQVTHQISISNENVHFESKIGHLNLVKSKMSFLKSKMIFYQAFCSLYATNSEFFFGKNVRFMQKM